MKQQGRSDAPRRIETKGKESAPAAHSVKDRKTVKEPLTEDQLIASKRIVKSNPKVTVSMKRKASKIIAELMSARADSFPEIASAAARKR